ncbi:MAG: YHS domain-containing protein [Spirochaetales bacterium]|nr:YHS domain-containing protein [Spirochaetales bacterium]
MKTLLNTDSLGKFALQGYDAVAFHTQGKAVKADPYIAADYNGYKFLFATEQNKAEFLKNPQKYLPAFGGYCAFGISLGVFFPVEVETWEMVDGKVMFNYSKEIQELFHEDTAGNLAKAKANWAKTIA